MCTYLSIGNIKRTKYRSHLMLDFRDISGFASLNVDVYFMKNTEEKSIIVSVRLIDHKLDIFHEI